MQGGILEQCAKQVMSEATSESDTVLVGDDTYLLVLLCFLLQNVSIIQFIFYASTEIRFTTSTKISEH